jgi:hypothetical protein
MPALRKKMTLTNNRGLSEMRRSQRSAYLWLWIIFLMGNGCLLYASVMLVRNILFLRSSVSTTGTVIDFHTHRGNKFTTYAPIVSFKTLDGRSIRFRSQIGGNSDDYVIGQQVTVLYSPVDPKNAEIKAFSPLWFPVIALSVIGLALTAFSGGIMVILGRIE